MKIKDTIHIFVIAILVVVGYVFSYGIWSQPKEVAQPYYKAFPDVKYKEIQSNVAEQFLKQENCLAQNLYYEARGESYQGKLAVAQVVLNRVKSDQFPDTTCEVVYQKTNSVCQFSWVCEQHDKPLDPYAWQESVEIAHKALTSKVVYAKLASDNALFYHANYVQPGWHMRVVDIIGRHIFYTDGKT